MYQYYHHVDDRMRSLARQSWIASGIIIIALYFCVIIGFARKITPLDFGGDLVMKAFFVSLAAALLASSTYHRERQARRRFERIWNAAMDVATTNAMLHNLLPPSICKRIQNGENVRDEYRSAVVLFLQIENFDELFKTRSDIETFRLLHKVYTDLDKVTASFAPLGAFKVEHVGKDYMCASASVLGTQRYNFTPGEEVSHFCLLANALMQVAGKLHPEVRFKAGLTIGPLIAAVLGANRQFYRLFGDTVNTAARMCSNSVHGKLQVTAKAMDVFLSHKSLLSSNEGHVEECLKCEMRGLISVKGKGTMDTGFVLLTERATSWLRSHGERNLSSLCSRFVTWASEIKSQSHSPEEVARARPKSVGFAKKLTNSFYKSNSESVNATANERNPRHVRVRSSPPTKRRILQQENSNITSFSSKSEDPMAGEMFKANELAKFVVDRVKSFNDADFNDVDLMNAETERSRAISSSLRYEENSSDDAHGSKLHMVTGKFCNMKLEHKYLRFRKAHALRPAVLVLPPLLICFYLLLVLVLDATDVTFHQIEDDTDSSTIDSSLFLGVSLAGITSTSLPFIYFKYGSYYKLNMKISASRLFCYQTLFLSSYAISTFEVSSEPSGEYTFLWLHLILIFIDFCAVQFAEFMSMVALVLSWFLSFALCVYFKHQASMETMMMFMNATNCSMPNITIEAPLFYGYRGDKQGTPLVIAALSSVVSALMIWKLSVDTEVSRRLVWYTIYMLDNQEMYCRRFLRNVLPKAIVQRMQRYTSQRKRSLKTVSTFTLSIHKSLSRNSAEKIARQIFKESNKVESKRKVSKISVGQGTVGEMIECVVLCSDLCGFTKLAASISPSRLVNLLSDIFHVFDDLLDRRGLYKMDTIGDAYVAIGVIPLPSDESASKHKSDDVQVMRRAVLKNVTELGLEMQMAIQHISELNDVNVQQRIGVHIGPACCGLLGHLQTRFHVVGESLRVATELETQGVRDKVQISSIAFEILRKSTEGNFSFQKRPLRSAPNLTTLGREAYIVSSPLVHLPSLVRHHSSGINERGDEDGRGRHQSTSMWN